jgi:hypothetical protein
MPQRSDEGIGPYLGRSVSSFALLEVQKSAEVIVVGGYEPMARSEDSQTNEGPNIKLFQML